MQVDAYKLGYPFLHEEGAPAEGTKKYGKSCVGSKWTCPTLKALTSFPLHLWAALHTSTKEQNEQNMLFKGGVVAQL